MKIQILNSDWLTQKHYRHRHRRRSRANLILLKDSRPGPKVLDNSIIDDDDDEFHHFFDFLCFAAIGRI